MKIYRIAFRNPMDTATNTLASKILNVIMNLYKTNRLFALRERTSSIQIQYKGFEAPINATIHIEVVDQDVQQPFLVNAQYSSNQPSPYTAITDPNAKSINRKIDIHIHIAKNFSPKFFHAFYMDTVMVVRHELTHLIQDQEKMPLKYPRGYDMDALVNAQDPVQRFSEIRNYLTSLFEQEPFIRGFMLACKKQGKPIMTALQTFIHEQLFSPDPAIEKHIKNKYGLEAEHIEPMLMNLYQKRVKELFPNTKNIV